MSDTPQSHTFITTKTLADCITCLERLTFPARPPHDKIYLISESIEEQHATIHLTNVKPKYNSPVKITAAIDLTDENTHRTVAVTVTLSNYTIFLFILMLAGWFILSITLLNVTRFAACLFLIGIPLSVVWYQAWQRRLSQAFLHAIQHTLTKTRCP